MRTALKVGLAIGAVLLALGGLYAIFFGAVYQGTYIAGTEGACGQGCSYSTANETTVIFANYLFWNPPSFAGANYSVTTCTITAATYTPQNPPPTCLYPPATMSTDYTKNYVGVFLIILSAITGVALVLSRERKLVASPSTVTLHDPEPEPSTANYTEPTRESIK